MTRFPVAMRGYERAQVDALMARIEVTLRRDGRLGQAQAQSHGHGRTHGYGHGHHAAKGTATGPPAEPPPAPPAAPPAEPAAEQPGDRPAAGSGDGHVLPISAEEVRGTRFDIVMRGYDQRAVDEVLQEHIRSLMAAARRPRSRRPAVRAAWLIDWIENAQFGSSGLRSGYDVRDVDAFLDRVVAGLRGTAPQITPEDIVHSRFRAVRFGPGYDEEEVDLFLDQLAAALNGGSPPPR